MMAASGERGRRGLWARRVRRARRAGVSRANKVTAG